ncbi:MULTISPECIES: hypothetical protein [unclassified Marinobacter]|uniref:hypothetical protein n=1 Tax=unclassified Marinobacter TaxID=83889 RepID=UPI00126957BD|nr:MULTISPECIES: hypothetical protein [unclassified Marinobacter]QFS86652.1 hypothetical protein FIV08_07370 [Marinobacter sp. THAF197a]QFT50436.1 hypothetical protein FIU96_07300 [Marinobacter sp. THAF39]QFT52958.1 hypothetical protein FIU96_20105 [Marinobacter sp. THAF39]
MTEGVLKAAAEKMGARLQKEQSVFLSPETLTSLCQTVIHTVLNNDGQYGLHVGWTGWYTRKGGERWFWCRIIAFDNGDPVIKTMTGNYHRRPTHSFEFSKELEGE